MKCTIGMLAAMAALQSAEAQKTYSNSVTGAGVTLKWNVTEACELDFELSKAGEADWIALGVGSGMVNSKAIIAEPTLGDGEVHEVEIGAKNKEGVKLAAGANGLEKVTVAREGGNVVVSGQITSIAGAALNLGCNGGASTDSVILATGGTGFAYHGGAKTVTSVNWQGAGDDSSAAALGATLALAAASQYLL